jgi:hypothetical protein
MATGSGKTVVMAMLIAWQTLNKVANPQDARFARHFLVITPGITIRDRLRVLQPDHPDNYYRLRDLVPAELYGSLGQARIVITNFHRGPASRGDEHRRQEGQARRTRPLHCQRLDACRSWRPSPPRTPRNCASAPVLKVASTSWSTSPPRPAPHPQARRPRRRRRAATPRRRRRASGPRRCLAPPPSGTGGGRPPSSRGSGRTWPGTADHQTRP